MFKTRLLSGIALIIVAFLLFFFGTPWLTAALCVISVIAYRELANILEISGKREDLPAAKKEAEELAKGGDPAKKLNLGGKPGATEVVGYVAIVAMYALLLAFHMMNVAQGEQAFALLAVVSFFVLAELFAYVLTFPKFHAEQVSGAVFAFLYAPLMLSFIDMTRALEDGKFLVWLILICSWGCDTCAYCVGMLIGKKKIFPVLSPKKSLEGCFGGVIGAALLGGLFAKFAMGRELKDVVILAVICALGAVASMVGDLAASAIKRNKGIKDYGKLIPGHGGIMDRFDSVIVTAPMVYFLSALLLH